MAGLYNQDDWMRNLIQISIVIFIMLQKKNHHFLCGKMDKLKITRTHGKSGTATY